jgi:exopolysaccharide biosynthesis protein
MIFHVWMSVFAMFFIARAGADEISATNEVLAGIFIHSETHTNPPERFWVAVVDLKNPKLKLRVSRGGADPDGDGKWKTTLMEPTKIADRENFDLVINGDYFIARGVNDGEGSNSMYRASQWARPEGPAMTDGLAWSVTTNARPCLVVHTNGAVTFEMVTQPDGDDFQVVGGWPILLHDGKIIPVDSKRNTARHPRTVVGLDATHEKLTLLLLDGRKPGIAAGMTYEELAAEMLRLGCTEALNLDGGGSSVMAYRKVGKMCILNAPTDGHERAVADVLGITVEN